MVREVLEPQYGEALSVGDGGREGGEAVDDNTVLLPSQWAKIRDPAYVAKADQWGRLNGEARSREIPIEGKAPTLTSSYRNPHNISTRFIYEEKNGLRREVPRFLSKRECCRLMGFPENYKIPSATQHGTKQECNLFYKQIGNAVCPPVIQAIAEMMLDKLRCSTSSTSKVGSS